MLNALRRQVNPATVMAFVALVFATTGGAVAVTSHNSANGNGNVAATAAKSKARPKGRPGPRGPAGPKGEPGSAGSVGPAGAKGEAGAAGAKGETGVAGAAGTNGKDGESVNISKLQPGEDGCVEGGSKLTAGGKETTACNGEKGEPGEGGGAGSFPATLPEGATETGVDLATFTSETGSTVVPISFPIQLPIPILAENIHYVSNEAQEKNTGPSQCSGNAEKPTAAKGNLCMYEAGGLMGTFTFQKAVGPSPGGDTFGETNVAGALLFTLLEKGRPSGEQVQFAWAVSAA